MVIGVPKELDNKKIVSEVEQFSKKFKLSTQETDELKFIMNSFCKYYNKMSDSSQMFEQDAIIESFDCMLETITETYNGTGTQTRANLFWKQLPTVVNMIKDKNSVPKKTEQDDDDDVYVSPKKHSTSSYTPPTYSSCGSSYSSYDYGGCGGGGYSGYGGSYGHC